MFKPGDKVKCVESTSDLRVKDGTIYTVEAVFEGHRLPPNEHGYWVELIEVKNENIGHVYSTSFISERFELASTPIDWFAINKEFASV
jgi:hypothetical protein